MIFNRILFGAGINEAQQTATKNDKGKFIFHIGNPFSKILVSPAIARKDIV